MATEIREDSLNSGSLQSGLGAPTHLASKGTLFTDKTTGTVYVNKNGSNFWSNISTTGSTSGGGGTITSFGYTAANNTFSIVESGVTYSATINSMSGLTVSGSVRITSGLTANTISATTMTGSLDGTASLATNIASASGTDNRILYQSAPDKTATSSDLIWDGAKLVVKGDAKVINTVSANGFSGSTNTILASKGSVMTNGATTNAFIDISGSSTIGGTDYVDFISVTNTAFGAAKASKTFRLNIAGDIEIVNDGYKDVIFSLTDAGVLYTPGGGTSDKRLKNNIEYISGDSSSIILKLKPAKFEFNKHTGIKRHGFIAQDVLETTPELVLGNGEKENGVYGLDYDGILALTVKSLQEALIKINELEIKIKELNAK